MGVRCLHDQKGNETGCKKTWKERDSKQAWVVVIKDSQQPLLSPARHMDAPLALSGCSALRTGVRTPRPSHAVARANRTCHAVVASPIAAVPNAVTT